MTYPVVTDPARDGISVTVACRVLGFSRQAYYQWLADSVSERDWSDAHAANAILDAHVEVHSSYHVTPMARLAPTANCPSNPPAHRSSRTCPPIMRRCGMTRSATMASSLPVSRVTSPTFCA